MIRTVAIFVISALVLITVAIWMINAQFTGSIQEILMIAGFILVIGFALFMGVRRAKGLAKKEPIEDELTRKHMLKAASLAYYISIYFWLFIMYISDKVELESHSLIGAGIMGMAVIFFLSWLGIRIFGFRK